jgi:hypothetical protein
MRCSCSGYKEVRASRSEIYVRHNMHLSSGWAAQVQVWSGARNVYMSACGSLERRSKLNLTVSHTAASTLQHA